MKGTILYGPHDVRFKDRSDPKIIEPTDAIIRNSLQLTGISSHMEDPHIREGRSINTFQHK